MENRAIGNGISAPVTEQLITLLNPPKMTLTLNCDLGKQICQMLFQSTIVVKLSRAYTHRH